MTVAQRTFRWTPASGADCAAFPLAGRAPRVQAFARAALEAIGEAPGPAPGRVGCASCGEPPPAGPGLHARHHRTRAITTPPEA